METNLNYVSMVRANATESARIIKVIETVATRGSGREGDPERMVTQYWTLKGKFLAEDDPHRRGMNYRAELAEKQQVAEAIVDQVDS